MEIFADAGAATRGAIPMAAGNHGTVARNGGVLAPTIGGRSDCRFPTLRKSADPGALRSLRADFQPPRRNHSTLARSVLGNVCDLRSLLCWSDLPWTSPNIRAPEHRAMRALGRRIHGRHDRGAGHHAHRSASDGIARAPRSRPDRCRFS